jgi:hypothetical protein
MFGKINILIIEVNVLEANLVKNCKKAVSF